MNEMNAGEPPKPLLRGWSHALAAVVAVALTIALCWASRGDPPRLVSMLIFGLSMVELYALSATYHILPWPAPIKRVFRSIDHANIFVLIAGTYTPLCFNLLHGWVRVALLATIWSLALIGIGLAVFASRIPRWVNAALYVGMGWVAVLAFPAFAPAVPWAALATLVLGGVLYTIGALIYSLKRPNPFPRVFGFHEVFHLFVIAGSAAFVVAIWAWALPFPRV
ncbi:MAG TPA: hemolysin III family protein [Ktedonobacterales bacterium]|nr:hemolysin III family protein [Ktedonobacterales bacterium]